MLAKCIPCTHILLTNSVQFKIISQPTLHIRSYIMYVYLFYSTTKYSTIFLSLNLLSNPHLTYQQSYLQSTIYNSNTNIQSLSSSGTPIFSQVFTALSPPIFFLSSSPPFSTITPPFLPSFLSPSIHFRSKNSLSVLLSFAQSFHFSQFITLNTLFLSKLSFPVNFN